MTNKQAACLTCRKSKIKCRREPGEESCQKCQQGGAQCIIPSFHIGRQKGVKNKRTGLEKAIYQIEEAIRKSKSENMSSSSTLEQLRSLLGEAPGGLQDTADTASSTSATFVSERDGTASDDQLALDDAENPLQLLARASDLRLTSPKLTEPSSSPSSRYLLSEQEERSDVHRFFLPMKAALDQGPDVDPIDIGLVTLEEAETLLSFFYENLAHTRWGLDPLVYTLPFIRTRSAFLFTSLLTASALFLPTAAAPAKRLLNHRNMLAQKVISQRYRSVEIVLAFLVNVPWMHPGVHTSDDDTGLYISIALSTALDLSLNKIIIPSWSFNMELLKRIPKADCIDAKKALAMDGFEDIEVGSEWGQRLLRRRERVWIALFVLERGVCLARGRNYCVPITPLLKHCDKWHMDGVSDVQDGSLISMAVLRRDLDGLFSAVRSRCDSYRVIDVGSEVAQEIERTIEKFFDQWLNTWTASIGEGGQRTLPPYVEILVTHTRLSTYSGVINHPTAPLEVKQLFRASALSSALNVMRAAIQGEARLKSMPNNTVIMICFAACIALNLSASAPGVSHNLVPSVRNLIEETSAVLERIGSTPNHRNGLSVLYGKHLRELVKQSSVPSRSHHLPSGSIISSASNEDTNQVFSNSNEPFQPFSQPQAQYAQPDVWSEPLQFSAMSGNEVIETVMNTGDFNASTMFDLSMADTNDLAWMDWNWMNLTDFGF
ncbi:Zn(II)2Cys6 transcription factor [Lojkania enalia]|uniref:Zn(II)2Cys6 transcription factor n=1 Tax=Lojkania enalia TaxID=147567 RepID=A0A9P4KCH6_9PLEO|nr:Zn(II)2Cys6 transcription factor [Didymosphaeria enalia]